MGLVDEQPSTRRKEETCKICFDAFPVSDMAAARCKHYFCRTCWKGYVHTAVDSGPACLDLRCPDPVCRAVVPTALVLDSCDAAHQSRYKEFSLRSFVDDNKRLAWCTAPGCTNAAEALIDAPREPLDVHCLCGNSFCFTCKEEAHRPVDCETVRAWLIKNSAESENMTWILANTKPCPKCTRPIEKNQGCMHMTCSQCRHEFCWLCTGPWSEHGERTGGFYNCNTFKKRRDKGEIDEAEEQRNRAKASLERYMHYWQRWAEHDKARRTALRQMATWEEQQLEELSERTATPSSQLRFVLDAWKEVVSCRRVLKWTYAVGYYAFDDGQPGEGEAAERRASHKEFFEFTQQDAENALERMNYKVEKQLPEFLREGEAEGSVDPAKWAAFRQELIGLTDVTRTQFAKLVDFLEKGLDRGLAEFGGGGLDEEADGLMGAGDGGGDGASGSGSKPDAGGSGGAFGAVRRSDRLSKRTRGAGKKEGDEPKGSWTCPRCNFDANEGTSQRCEMCHKPQRAR